MVRFYQAGVEYSVVNVSWELLITLPRYDEVETGERFKPDPIAYDDMDEDDFDAKKYGDTMEEFVDFWNDADEVCYDWD